MKEHELKCWPSLFQPTMVGFKELEYRLNDRNFEPGDTLWLREFEPTSETYTGLNCRVLVRSVWTAEEIPGLPEGYCIMQTMLVQSPWQYVETAYADSQPGSKFVGCQSFPNEKKGES